MKTIKSYKYFLEEKTVNDIILYIDNSVNESIDVKSIWDNTIRKIKDLSIPSKKKVLTHLLATMLAINTTSSVLDTISKSEMSPELKEFATGIVKHKAGEEEEEESKWKKGYEFEVSDKLIEHIKEEEQLRLKAYTIGDGMISIGWGHAEPIGKSNYNIGDRISEEEAEELLKKDLANISNGVSNIFREWEEKDINVEITQDMYDALVSIAYNTGVGGLRRSELIKDIKRGDYASAGEKIKTFKVSKKFPGLASRRQKESEMFLASI